MPTERADWTHRPRGNRGAHPRLMGRRMTDLLARLVDLETTGETAPEHAVIQIAALDILDDRIAALRSSLVNPYRPIPPDASAIHGFIDADVAGAPPFDLAAAAVMQCGRPDFYVAHNAPFDLQWLAEPSYGVPWICTQKCAMRVWPESPRFGLQFLRYWLALDVHVGRAHRAPADCLVLAHVFMMLRQLASIEDMVAWSAEPQRWPRIPFGEHKGKTWSNVPGSYLDWMLSERGVKEPDMIWNARRERDIRFEARQEAYVVAFCEDIKSTVSVGALEVFFVEHTQRRANLEIRAGTPWFGRVVAACAAHKATLQTEAA